MIKRILPIIVVLMFVFLPVVAAVETEIQVKTEPYHGVTFVILANSEKYSLITTLSGFSYAKGIATVTHSGTEENIGISIIVKDGEETVLVNKKFLDIATGKTHYFVVTGTEQEEVDGPFEEIVTEEIIEEPTAEETSEEVEDIPEITGQVTGTEEDSGFGGNTVFYIIGVVVLVGIVGLIFAKRNFMKNAPHLFGGKKDFTGDKEDSREEYSSKELKEAEERIRKDQKEIEHLKRRGKELAVEEDLKEKERELDKKRDELKKLRSED